MNQIVPLQFETEQKSVILISKPQYNYELRKDDEQSGG